MRRDGAPAQAARDVYERAGQNYLDLVADMGAHVYGQDKAAYLLGIPLALDSRVIVELGSAFSFYDLGHSYEWSVAQPSESVSTRIFLAAARLMAVRGVESVVYSVDIREPIGMRLRLPVDFGLDRYHRPQFGSDSVAWLGAFEGTIDVLFCDSRHTYRQITSELDAALPKLSERCVVIVDNCYTTTAEVGDPEPGGKFAALQAWSAAHAEFHPTWTKRDMLILTRGFAL
ncbi:MAG: class I SAM-dependent methyltransferase [Dehalococcoidia bacterium]